MLVSPGVQLRGSVFSRRESLRNSLILRMWFSEAGLFQQELLVFCLLLILEMCLSLLRMLFGDVFVSSGCLTEEVSQEYSCGVLRRAAFLWE